MNRTIFSVKVKCRWQHLGLAVVMDGWRRLIIIVGPVQVVLEGWGG